LFICAFFIPVYNMHEPHRISNPEAVLKCDISRPVSGSDGVTLTLINEWIMADKPSWIGDIRSRMHLATAGSHAVTRQHCAVVG